MVSLQCKLESLQRQILDLSVNKSSADKTIESLQRSVSNLSTDYSLLQARYETEVLELQHKVYRGYIFYMQCTIYICIYQA